jgi:glycosyltransferase involved in cell wall biosynthesis
MMRILHLIPTLQGGGAERQLVYLAGGLRALGCDVHVGLRQGGTNLPRLEAAQATVHHLGASSNYDPRLLPAIVGLIRRVKPDVVQTWLTQMDVFGGMAALLTRTPWILSERSSGVDYPKDLRYFLRSALGRHATAVIANSAPGLRCWNGAPARQLVVGNAIPFAEYTNVPCDPADFGNAKVILFAGRMEAEKNLPTLIAALREVIAQRDAIALICGTGPLVEEIRASIAAAGTGDRIRLLGFCENLPGLMKRADVLVAPSWFEGHPNVPIEAAAVGCPLVVSDIAAHRSWLDDHAALFAPPADPHALALAILQTLDDPAAARVRAERARELVSHWSVESASSAYLRVYEELRTRRRAARASA